MKTKEQNLVRELQKMDKLAVAYSGGIDSSYLLKKALDTLGAENVLAVVVNSELFSDDEFDKAVDLANGLGANVLGLEMSELADDRIVANNPNSWFYSKKLLYKIEIRQLAKDAGISNWSKVASCSIASRIPYGIKLTRSAIDQVFASEKYLREIGFPIVRVRAHHDLARIEIPEDKLSLLLENREKIADYLKKQGFNYVTFDLEGFKSGRMNDILTETEKKVFCEC